MYSNRELYERLLILIKLFDNKPHFLAKYLIDNSALSSEFIDNIMCSTKLENLENLDLKSFKTISEMNNFFKSLVTNIDFSESIPELIKKLDALVDKEKYEEAAKLRDYINSKKN